MKAEIKRFIKKVCLKYDLKALYIPDGDIYMIHKDGRAVQNFTGEQFYQMPKRARIDMYEPLVRIGLNHNLGEKYRNQIFINRQLGKKII